MRTEHDLPVLRLRVGGHAASRWQAVFEAVLPGREPEEVARCPLGELGLPSTADELQGTREQAFGVPRKVLNSISAAAERLGPSPLAPAEALWLDFRGPRGYLYILPWERMLQPLGRLILRRPVHALRPTVSSSALTVGLCASAPETPLGFETVPLLERLSGVWAQRSGREVKIHVFTDPGAVAAMREWAAGSGLSAVVHEPPRRIRTRASIDSRSLGNPWLQWIRDAVGGTALDVVHFAAHGYLDHDRGEVALAATPDPVSAPGVARFVGAPDMLSFMAQVGAWCLTLTGPQGNQSPAGLRELADAVSTAGPCVAAVHETATDDGELGQLGDAVATLMGQPPAGLGALPAVTCWVHPQSICLPRTEEQQDYLTPQGNSTFIDDSTREVIARDDTPAWVASATRTVESLQAKWVPRDPDQAMDDDAKQALEAVASLVEKHVERET